MDKLPNLCTYTDFRDNMPAHFKRLERAGQPTLVTQKGKAAAVVLSPAAYERLSRDAELARSQARIAKSIAQFRAGRGVPVDEALAAVQTRIASRARRRAGSAKR